MLADLPSECWVLTSADAPHLIKDASPEWCALWSLPAEEAFGKPVSILNERDGCDLEAASLLMVNFKRDGKAKMHCTNARKDGTLLGHDIELQKTAEGILATSTGITKIEPLFPSGSKRSLAARDAEVFGLTGHAYQGAQTATRRPASGRDGEFFDDDDDDTIPASAASFTALFSPGTGRLSARDLEVFDPSEPMTIPTPPAAAARHLSARDQEYFDDGSESGTLGPLKGADAEREPTIVKVEYPPGVRPGARDLEVFGHAETPEVMVLPLTAARRLSGRDQEYFCDAD